jgi:hypothetical protein
VNVLDTSFRVVGIVAVSDLLRAYRTFLEQASAVSARGSAARR